MATCLCHLRWRRRCGLLLAVPLASADAIALLLFLQAYRSGSQSQAVFVYEEHFEEHVVALRPGAALLAQVEGIFEVCVAYSPLTDELRRGGCRPDARYRMGAAKEAAIWQRALRTRMETVLAPGPT